MVLNRLSDANRTITIQRVRAISVAITNVHRLVDDVLPVDPPVTMDVEQSLKVIDLRK